VTQAGSDAGNPAHPSASRPFASEVTSTHGRPHISRLCPNLRGARRRISRVAAAPGARRPMPPGRRRRARPGRPPGRRRRRRQSAREARLATRSRITSSAITPGGLKRTFTPRGAARPRAGWSGSPRRRPPSSRRPSGRRAGRASQQPLALGLEGRALPGALADVVAVDEQPGAGHGQQLLEDADAARTQHSRGARCPGLVDGLGELRLQPVGRRAGDRRQPELTAQPRRRLDDGVEQQPGPDGRLVAVGPRGPSVFAALGSLLRSSCSTRARSWRTSLSWADSSVAARARASCASCKRLLRGLAGLAFGRAGLTELATEGGVLGLYSSTCARALARASRRDWSAASSRSRNRASSVGSRSAARAPGPQGGLDLLHELGPALPRVSHARAAASTRSSSRAGRAAT
jgi:hypothetical protein